MQSPINSTAMISQNSEAEVKRAVMLGSLQAHRGKSMTDAQATAVAKDFEAMFMAQMMEPMFGDSTGAEQFGNDESKDIYKGLLMNEYGKGIAKSGGIGIASLVKRELLKMQEVTHE
jgi:flagellar protein FlgJ